MLSLPSLINDTLRVAVQDPPVHIPQMLSPWLQTHSLGLELTQSKPESMGSDEQ
jgi:hypothetical protein